MTDGTGDPRFLDAAAALGARLCREAVWDGARCNWMGDAQDVVGGRLSVVHRAMGPTLYDGTAGIALFLARLHAATGERPFRTAARGALRQAAGARDRVPPQIRIALHAGWTGLAWAMAHAAEAMEDAEWMEEAGRMAAALPAIDPHPAAVDVISGSAGAIPALLDLAARLDRPALADTAARHGDFLLSLARRGEMGWSWHTLDSPVRADLTGYSHGAAGIALALLELAEATGDERFRTGAEGGFRYEAACFVPDARNWPDFRLFGPAESAGPPSCALAWCHGAPGIGLSRLRAYVLTGDDARREEAQAALGSTLRGLEASAAGGGFGMSLCHGDAGNAELPLEAARVLGFAEGRARAAAVGHAAVARYGEDGEPWPCGVPNGGESPGLLIGLAGIGHFFLRLHDPAIPSVLLIAPEGRGRAHPRSAVEMHAIADAGVAG